MIVQLTYIINKKNEMKFISFLFFIIFSSLITKSFQLFYFLLSSYICLHTNVIYNVTSKNNNNNNNDNSFELIGK
jgi:hypothetical protein